MDCTCSALRMAARRLSQAYDAALAPERLTVSQFSVLAKLARRGPDGAPTVQDLADELGVDRTTLGHNLRPLERDRLVTVAPDAHDRRVRRIHLLPLGQTKWHRCVPLWRAAQDRFDASFGHDASRALRESLIALAAHAAPADPDHETEERATCSLNA